MHGSYSHFNNTYSSPSFLVGETLTRTGKSSVYTFNTQHQIPINGNFSFGWSHSSGGSDNEDHSSSSSYSLGAGITPWSRLGLSSSFSYTTNLSEAWAFNLFGPSAGTLNIVERGSNGLFVMNSASLAIGHGFNVNGHFSWRQENFPTATYSDTQYGGTLTYHYTHRMFGSFYVSGGAIDSANKLGNTGTGLTGTAGMDRHFGRWDTSADINYMHNVQTLYSVVNTSSMNYGGTIRRKINPQMYLAVFFRASRSGLVTQSGTGNLSNSYGASLSWKGYSFTGNYSASSGTAILTGSGTLVPTPTGPIFTPDFVYFDAKAYSVSASKRFFRRLNVSGVYSQVESTTTQKNGDNSNSGNRFGVTTSYQMRKMALLGGFSRSSQSFSSIVGGPRVVNSYYVSFSRWFNLF